ncbi:hypothetical protein [Acidisoma sp. C75]
MSGAGALAILLISGSHERAHYAFALAAGAAALGRSALIFATNGGCRALCADWSGLEDAARDAAIQGRGLAGLDDLRAACVELGVRFRACEAGLRAEAIAPARLMAEAEPSGIAAFLAESAGAQLVTL